MYDDLLGPKKEAKKPKLKANLTSAPGAQSTKDAQGHGSVSSCSDDCDCEGDCEGHPDGPSPKDPWADVDEEDEIEIDLADIKDLMDEDECEGDCDNCSDEDCKSVDDQIEELFEMDDDDEIEPSQDIGC